MAVSATNSTATNPAVYENPKSKLGSQEFLQLFLTELQYQDPTEPMDNEKILTQTSQLSTLENNDKLATSLEAVVNKLEANSQFSIISAIGKTANTGVNTIDIEGGNGVSFDMLFKNPIESGTLKITDSYGKTIKSLDLSEYQGMSGTMKFSWDATDSNGKYVSDGAYKVVADYMDSSGKVNSVKFGEYEIESVKFNEGKALLKLGANYIPADEIEEIY